MKRMMLMGVVGVLLSSAAPAAPDQPAPEKPSPPQAGTRTQARIPFANHGTIRNWQADGDRALYLQADGGQWYRAELMGYCPDLNFADTIGFETLGTGDFDNFSNIVVRGRRCPLASLVKSDPPPRKAKPAKKD